MGEPPKVESIEALGVHIWHMQQKLEAVSSRLQSMATHDDIRGIKETIAGLATKAELQSLRDEMNRGSPGSLWKRFAIFCGQVTVVAAAVGVLVAFIHSVEQRVYIQSPPTSKSTP